MGTIRFVEGNEDSVTPKTEWQGIVVPSNIEIATINDKTINLIIPISTIEASAPHKRPIGDMKLEEQHIRGSQ
jgi:hypothetical protein